MTKAQEVYADTLNLIGSDLDEEPTLRRLLDHEHELADPAFELILAERAARTFTTA